MTRDEIQANLSAVPERRQRILLTAVHLLPLYNADIKFLRWNITLFDSADAALECGFDWDESPQKWEYWDKFHDQLCSNEITLTVPAEEVEATPDYEAKTYTESEVLDMIEAFLKSDLSELEKHLLELEMTEREFAKHALSFIKSKTEKNETSG